MASEKTAKIWKEKTFKGAGTWNFNLNILRQLPITLTADSSIVGLSYYDNIQTEQNVNVPEQPLQRKTLILWRLL